MSLPIEFSEKFKAPDGVTIHACEFAAIWPVNAIGEETLSYADGKGLVAKNVEVILEHEPGKYLEASRFASRLRDMGWKNVTVCTDTEEPAKVVDDELLGE